MGPKAGAFEALRSGTSGIPTGFWLVRQALKVNTAAVTRIPVFNKVCMSASNIILRIIWTADYAAAARYQCIADGRFRALPQPYDDSKPIRPVRVALFGRRKFSLAHH